MYTAAENFPMLPEKLSTDWTSLNENEDRLALVIEMSFRPDATLDASDVYRAAVRNKAKLAYDSVSVGLEGGEFPERARAVAGAVDQLRLQDGLAQALRRRRHEQGALDLETIEPRAVFENDTIVGLSLQEKNRARQLIEIAGVVVVDRDPEPVAQVAHARSHGSRPVDRGELGEDVAGKVRFEALFDHRLTGDGSELLTLGDARSEPMRRLDAPADGSSLR